jgi:hypothetical protein
VAIPLGILGVLMIIFGSYISDVGYVSSQMEQISRGNKLQIEGPVDAVKVISPIEKTPWIAEYWLWESIQKGMKRYLGTIKPSDNKYYPQSDHTNTSYKRDGEWQVVTRFGGDLGEAYDLIIYEADPDASSFFSSTIEKWKEAEEYPGLLLEEMPAGAKELDRIEVYTRKNCRGVF